MNNWTYNEETKPVIDWEERMFETSKTILAALYANPYFQEEGFKMRDLVDLSINSSELLIEELKSRNIKEK